MYRSMNTHGTPIAVTGMVLMPDKRWPGRGPRPLVAYAAGTQGLADTCAPSSQLAAGTEYEGMFIKGLLARGYAVVVSDYEGSGTEGVHTFMNRSAQATAVLDAIRAAQRLPEVDIPADGPVGITGYSEGGGAAAAAAELAPSYAPEINLVAVAAGSVPSELKLVVEKLDGSLYSSFLSYAVVGLAEAYDIDADALLSDRGKRQFEAIKKQCVFASLPLYAFTSTTSLMKTGKPLSSLFDVEPFKTIIDEQEIGRGRKPDVPVLLTHSVLDDAIPYAAGRNLAKRWCDQGADVRFSANAVPTHPAAILASYPEAFLYLEARFAGIPQASNCWRI
jgi:alpha-beta hydrolase superfamily lysophospholipase